MIILDTCILRACGFGASTDLLRALRATKAHAVAVPWMVLEELAAQKTIAYNDKHQKALDAAKSLQEATPWPDLRSLPSPRQSAQIREHWRNEYRKIVDVIPTSAEVLQEAAFREANRLPPCGEKKGMKTGGRDAAIWLSAVEYAREHPDETVYFVSENTNDFGDGDNYPQLMLRDIEPLGDRFVHFTKLDQVFERFTERAWVNEAQVESIISSDNSMRYVIDTALTSGVFEGRFGSMDDGSQVLVDNLIGGPTIFLEALQDVDAYCVGDTEWCTATANWTVFQNAEWGAVVAFVWETRLLVTLNDEHPAMSILRTIDVRPPENDALATIPASVWKPQIPGLLPSTTERSVLQLLASSAVPADARYRAWARRKLGAQYRRSADDE